MNSTYVTFGDFNKPEPPPPHMNESFEMGSYDQQRSNQFQPTSQQPGRYPIRQHMTQPRNPYAPQMLPPYPRNEMPGSRYNDAPPMMMMPQPPPPPLNMPFPQRNMVSLPPPSSQDFDMPSNATPIGKAFSEEFDMPMSSSSKDEMGNGYQRDARMNRLLDATCVDINDHIMNCPICSKYYQNHTTVYVGIIILLGFIILIFLLKSIMEIKR